MKIDRFSKRNVKSRAMATADAGARTATTARATSVRAFAAPLTPARQNAAASTGRIARIHAADPPFAHSYATGLEPGRSHEIFVTGDRSDRDVGRAGCAGAEEAVRRSRTLLGRAPARR